MTDAEIHAIVGKLDRELPKDKAVVVMKMYGGGPDESQIIATRNGYLRLGVELLKAAIAAKGDKGVPCDLSYLMHEDSDVGFDHFERPDEVKGNIRQLGRAPKWVPMLFVGLFIIAAVLAFIGLVTVVTWAIK